MNAITSAGIIHKTDRVGPAGYVTGCGVAIPKHEAEHAKVFYDRTGRPTTTKRYGKPCDECFMESEK